MLAEVADSYLNFQVVALREMEERASLAVAPDVLATVPYFDTDIYDLAGLLRLGRADLGVGRSGAADRDDPARRAVRCSR